MYGVASVIIIAQKAYEYARKRWRYFSSAVMLAVIIGAMGDRFTLTSRTATAADEDARAVFEMVQQGKGPAAVAWVADAALARGAWGAAPGDTVVFDRTLASTIRGEVMVRDRVPGECANPRLARTMSDVCGMDLVGKQSLVRFGAMMFCEPQPDGSLLERPTFDDVLSTYIEEVGHSWQEYLYETEGLGSGPRTRLTSWEDAMILSPFWEYQIKRYILSLDGILLTLSELERGRLRDDICEESGYANPLGHRMIPYSAPATWPNRAGWPVTEPTSDDLRAFCMRG